MRVFNFLLQSIRPYQFYFYLIFGVMVINAFNSTLKPYLIKCLIDTVTKSHEQNLIFLISFYGLSEMIMICAWTLSDWCGTRYIAQMKCHSINIFIKYLYQCSYQFFHHHLAGSISSKINDIFNCVPNITTLFFYQFMRFSLITTFSLIMLAQVHLTFCIGMIIWMIIFSSLTFKTIKPVMTLNTDRAEAQSKVWGHIVDGFNNILTIKKSSSHFYEFKHLENYQQDYIKKNQKSGLFLAKFYAIQGIIVTFYVIFYLCVLILCHKYQKITLGDFALIFALQIKVVDELFDLSHHFRDFINAWSTLDQALKILDEPLEIQEKKSAHSLKITQGQISFDTVDFQYPERNLLFKHKSVIIKGGQKVGLVGYSGAGKSTFIHLILRLFDPIKGRILIDNQDIKHVSFASLHAAVHMIPQDPSLFHRTIAENICYGCQDTSEISIIKASKQAYAHDFIMQLPQKYKTIVGERGVKLSGGQKQRIAIANAFLKNAPILILDEATSQLDSMTEVSIQKSFGELMFGKTTLVIAHRLSTLAKMDRILVFDQGQIVEQGPPNFLLNQKGLYAKLWNAQVGGFLPED